MRTTIKNHYFKDRPEGVSLMSGCPLPKSPDGVVRSFDFVDCSFHPNCKHTKFEGCTFVGCDNPNERPYGEVECTTL